MWYRLNWLFPKRLDLKISFHQLKDYKIGEKSQMDKKSQIIVDEMLFHQEQFEKYRSHFRKKIQQTSFVCN